MADKPGMRSRAMRRIAGMRGRGARNARTRRIAARQAGLRAMPAR